jgi:putative flippase GtrA
VLTLLIWCGVNGIAANITGFIAGAWLSFELSIRHVWGDRARGISRRLELRLAFYTTAGIALVVNTTTFTVVTAFWHTAPIVASLCGVVAGSSVTFFVNDKLTFRRHNFDDSNDDEPTAQTALFDYDLTVVIPAYREASLIGSTLIELAAFLTKHSFGKVQVIVVAATSIDDTAGIARKYAQLFDNFVLIHAGDKVGKGRDVALGMLYGRGRYRLFFDADLATPLSHLHQVQEFIDNGGEMGVGVRNVGHYHNTLPRNLISRAASLVARILIAPNVRDTQCGFKVFRADVAETLFSRIRLLQWNFDMELIAMARKFRHNIDTFAIPDWSDPKAEGEGMTGDSLWAAIMHGAVEPFMIRLRIMRGQYATPGPIHQYTQSVSAEIPA